MSDPLDRGTFLKGSPAASTLLVPASSPGAVSDSPASATEPSKPSLPKRPLGKTGEQVTIYGLGGLFTASMPDRHDQAVEMANSAIDLGINHIDTPAWYGAGASELNIGTVLKKRRNELLLASKSHDYSYDGTMALFEQSLKRPAGLREAPR